MFRCEDLGDLGTVTLGTGRGLVALGMVGGEGLVGLVRCQGVPADYGGSRILLALVMMSAEDLGFVRHHNFLDSFPSLCKNGTYSAGVSSDTKLCLYGQIHQVIFFLVTLRNVTLRYVTLLCYWIILLIVEQRKSFQMFVSGSSLGIVTLRTDGTWAS